MCYALSILNFVTTPHVLLGAIHEKPQLQLYTHWPETIFIPTYIELWYTNRQSLRLCVYLARIRLVIFPSFFDIYCIIYIYMVHVSSTIFKQFQNLKSSKNNVSISDFQVEYMM